MASLFIWTIAGLSILLMLIRPRRTPEALWVCLGAGILVLTHLVSPQRAFAAIRLGWDVYLFLTGMMLLSELARHTGVFDWVADVATHHARGSSLRLFFVVYLVGALVTALLSNDATAVVLTPAVLAAVRRAKVEARPHLLACAFIANAASFVFPISNPANLVIYQSHLPRLFDWLRIFWLASLASVATTYFCLRFLTRSALSRPILNQREGISLTSEGRLAFAALLIGAGILLTASARGLHLGLPACAVGILAVALVSVRDRRALVAVPKGVSWSVLPLVAGLFVIVEAIGTAGLLGAARAALAGVAADPGWIARCGTGFSVAILSNLINNLPVALASGAALQGNGIPPALAHAALLGVDIGPNLSVTGSLATILWLIALRRENVEITAWQFLKAGFIVMPVSLIAALLLCRA